MGYSYNYNYCAVGNCSKPLNIRAIYQLTGLGGPGSAGKRDFNGASFGDTSCPLGAPTLGAAGGAATARTRDKIAPDYSLKFNAVASGIGKFNQCATEAMFHKFH